MSDRNGSGRRSWTRTEVAVVFAMVVVAMALFPHVVVFSRDVLRRTQCQNNLRRIGLALHAYHDVHSSLPPAAIWRTTALDTLALHLSHRPDLFIGANWVQMILPQAGEPDLASQLDWNVPVSATANETARMRRLAWMTCPSDAWNTKENAYLLPPPTRETLPVSLARGNYAINGGSQNRRMAPGTSAQPSIDGTHVIMDSTTRFISNDIDPSLWHVMHSRETPPDVLTEKGRESSIERRKREEASVESPEIRDGGGRIMANSVGMEFAWISPGEFTMGIPDDGNAQGVPPECPPHRVRMTRGFWLGRFEATQQQFEHVMGENPSWPGNENGTGSEGGDVNVAVARKGDLRSEEWLGRETGHNTRTGTGFEQGGGRFSHFRSFPVKQVTWYQAVEFCRRLSERSEEREAGRVYRLPTEAE